MSPEAAIRILMVDDHTIVRDGMKNLLELDGTLQVVGTASSAEEALVLVDRVPCDLVLLDIGLPVGDGVWCATRMREKFPHLRILILTMHTDENLLSEALEAGVNGYILKSASYDEVRRAIRDVHEGRTYIEPRMAGLLIDRMRRRAHAPERTVLDALSPREREILGLAASGFNNHQIAARLMVTENTVKTHLRGIYRKCGVNDRVQAVLCAVKGGLVPTPEATR